MTMQLTEDARKHEPTGDPEHIAYGQDYTWSCSCGRTSEFIYSQKKAERNAEAHERYCGGETVVDVIA